MEASNVFDGGMKTDYSQINQPQRTYTWCFNGINISEDGDIFSLNNEKGTTSKVSNFPAGFKIIGGYVLGTDFICCLANPTGPYSQVGIVDANFSYTRKAPNSDTNNDLGFTITHQIDCVARKLLTGDRILYYTDNNVPPGYLNIDNPPATIVGNVNLFTDVRLPDVNFTGISEDGGNLHCGTYQFMARYRTKQLNTTPFGFVSNVIPIVDEKREVGRNLYDGGYPDYPTNIQKSIKVTITNVDTNFPYLELIALRYDGQSNELKAEALPLINITGDTTINYTYTGDDSNSTYLTKEDVTTTPVIYNTAKCIEHKDNRLILSNLGQNQEQYDFQSIANNIVLKYNIQEIQYIDGTSGPVSLSFAVSSSPYFLIEDGYIVYIQFTGQVDTTTATTLTNYLVNYAPDNPAAYAAGPDYVLDDRVTDSNNVYICIQASGSGANAPSGTTTSNTWWQYLTPYQINPTSVVVDPSNSSQVMLTMDTTVTSQVIQDGYAVTISGVKSYDTLSTAPTVTLSVNFEAADTTPLSAFYNDYKSEDRTYSMKGYQREEVYSFAMGVEWLDGSRSLAYHIPGYDRVTSVTTDADTVTKILGTYVSTATYSTGLGYPTGAVRHHKMPSLIQEPHFRVDSNGKTYLRILSIDFTNIVIPSDIQSKIRRVFFLRQSRSSSGNRSILAQGLVNNLFPIVTDFNYNNGAADASSTVYKKTPFFNNFSLSQSAAPFSGSPDSAKFSFGSSVGNVAAFFSPETILLQRDKSEFAKMKNVLTLTGSVTRSFTPSQNSNNPTSLSYSLRRPLLAWLFGNYNDYEIPGTQTILTISQSRYVQAQEKGLMTEFFSDYPVDNSISGAFLCVKTDVSIPNGNPNTLYINLQINKHTDTLQIGAKTVDNFDSMSGSDIIKNHLFNIYKDNNQQYGVLDESEYILIDVSTNVSATSYTGLFGGDVFITKFSFSNKDNYQYRSLYHKIIDNNYPGSPGKYVPAIDGYPYKGLDLRTLSYYFVESTVNTEYRHQYNNGVTSGPTYYPKSDYYTTLAVDPRNGDATSYNTQYSFENTIQSFFSKATTFVTVSSFEDRSIYSEEAKQDDVVDNYRVFLTNNYYDLPKHTGPIWDTFVSGNALYLHTPKCLWRAFFNDVIEKVNDIGETVQGIGGIFTLPSKEVLTSKGGYAGTISQWGGVHTPYGYIFPDALQGKVFLLANEQLTELSANGMMRYFSKHLKTDLVSGSNYIDNPANPSSYGIIGVYDYALKRYVLTKHGSAPFTISCSFLNPVEPTWVSFHSYTPHMYVAIDDKMIGFDNTSTVDMHEHNVGTHGVYYGASPANFELEYIINHDPELEKAFDNLFLYTTARNNGNLVYLETFKTLQCKTETKDTGLVTLICTNSFNDNSNVKKKRERYQVKVPKNTGASIYKDRMKGKWMDVKLTYPNTNDYKITLSFIDIAFRPIAR